MTNAEPSVHICPRCGAVAAGASNFCEECGAPLTAAAAAAAAAPVGPPLEASPLEASPISAATNTWSANPTSAPAARICASCGGAVGEDDYCSVCGVKALSARDHFRESPADWVAGVCDKGIRHHRNEDAMALSATPDGTAVDRRAVLVVLDGVSNTDDSQAGSLAGAKAALGVLRVPLPRGMGTPDSRLAAVAKVITEATTAANDAVIKAATADAKNPASATFCAAVLEGTTLTYANVGDSRIYWLPDAGDGRQLSVDDSAAQAQIAAGVSRKVAESGPQAHAITRWLGSDSEDFAPRIGELTLDTAGWLLVCSDGLWNYASEPAQIIEQIKASGATEPAALALALTNFANASGGIDNITVTFARVNTSASGQNANPAPDPTVTTTRETDG